jgi:hypothetical protein
MESGYGVIVVHAPHLGPMRARDGNRRLGESKARGGCLGISVSAHFPLYASHERFSESNSAIRHPPGMFLKSLKLVGSGLF